MPKPTEQEKLTKKTSYKSKGKIKFKDQELEVDIETVTTPNVQGGYDTVVKLPTAFGLSGDVQE